MSNASCSHRNRSPCRGFWGDVAVTFQPLLFLHFVTLCIPFLKPSMGLLGAHLGGCARTQQPKPSCCQWGMSTTCPGSEEHGIHRVMGRADPVAWLPHGAGAESGWLMSEQWPLSLFLWYLPPLTAVPW